MFTRVKGQDVNKAASTSLTHDLARSKPFALGRELPPASALRSGLDPKTTTPGAALRLQRAVGNRAVARLFHGVIQRQKAASEAEREDGDPVVREAEEVEEVEGAMPEGAPVEVDAATVEEDRQFQPEALLAAAREPIQILGELHHIEYREVNGKLVPGIATDWYEVEEIYQAFRRNNVLAANPGILRLRDRVGNQNRTVEDLQREIRELSARLDTLRYGATQVNSGRPRGQWRARPLNDITKKRIARATLERYTKSRALGLAQQELNRRIQAFINAAVNANDTIVAEILGANMPPIVRVTDVINTSAPGTYRYHTGAQGDPIPLTWYKPAAVYQDITVTDHTNPAAPVQVQLSAAANNPVVTDPRGNAYHFGVNANNFAMGKTWKNTPRHNKSRQNQRDLNGVLLSMGHDLSANHQDGDHVRDLGFEGDDVIDNYWPLDSTTNRLAYMGWRSLYYLNYKVQMRNGNWELEKAPLNSGTLVGKYFRVVAEEASTTPLGNNSEASGSDTGWGAAGTILSQGGTAIPEG